MYDRIGGDRSMTLEPTFPFPDTETICETLIDGRFSVSIIRFGASGMHLSDNGRFLQTSPNHALSFHIDMKSLGVRSGNGNCYF